MQKEVGGESLKAYRRCRALAKLVYQALDGKVSAAEFAAGKKRLEGSVVDKPAEACGIIIEGKNKWITLIQNASRKS